MKPFWIYILKCGDGSYYVGHTDDLEKRFGEHEEGFCNYTKNRNPLELVYSAEFASRDEALETERRVKGWSRGKKEALIKGDWEELRRLARGRKRNNNV